MSNIPEVKIYLQPGGYAGSARLYATINGKVYRLMRIDDNGAAMTVLREPYLKDKLPDNCIDISLVIETITSRFGEIMDPLMWKNPSGRASDVTQMRLQKNV